MKLSYLLVVLFLSGFRATALCVLRRLRLAEDVWLGSG